MDRAEIIALDKAHVWHPYTPMERYIRETDPLVVARAEGARLYDVDGRSYLDANSSWWVALLGHGHPRLVAALKAQADRLCHVALAGVAHEGAAALAARMAARAPKGLDHVFFSDDGSTALEAAIKMAVKLFHNEGKPNKTKFVALDGAFHGETVGVTSLLGIEVFRRPYAKVVMECVHVPSPARDERALERALDRLEREHETIAAIVVEPLVQGADGMQIYDGAYLRSLAARAAELDVLFIADEVFTGYGRTGTFWACEGAGVTPDILCTAKGFSGGLLPMAATLASKRVFDAFLGDPSRAFFYGHSYAGHPLGCAVARAVLDVYDDERVLDGVPERANRIAAAFTRIQATHPKVARRARSLGMIGAVDLAPDASYLGEIGKRVEAAARRRGAYLRPLGDVVYVAPPLNIPLPDLDELLDIVERSIVDVL